MALVLTSSAEFATLYFACLFLGAVAVPVNPGLHSREVAFVLAHSGVKLIICSPVTQKLVIESTQTLSLPLLCLLPRGEPVLVDDRTPVWSLDAFSVSQIPDWFPFQGVQGKDFFSITFTSGTTSMPKAVAHRISGLFENAIAFNEELGIVSGNRFLHLMPMAYMAGFLNTLLCPFIAGASVVITPPFGAPTALRFWQPVIQKGADTFWLSPTMLAALLRIDRNTAGLEYCCQHVKTICVGTAPLSRKVKSDFEQKYKVELLESYGLSELLFVANNSPRFPRVDGSVGRLLPGIQIQVVNEQGNRIKEGNDGEIWIKTPHIMAGYLNYGTLQPDPCDPKEWFATGDIGHVSEDGHVFITGRKKDLIIRGGINISPRTIEEVLERYTGVDQAVVIGLPHDFYGEEVVAVVKLKPGYTLDVVRPTLSALCEENLSAISIPAKFFTLDDLPTSSTGKVQKSKVREILLTKVNTDSRN